MFQTDHTTFENIVDEGIAAIPEEFREKLDNVSFFIEDFPNHIQRQKINLRKGWSLFGLYEGVSQRKRGSHYFGVLPDRITIFKRPIEYYSRDE